MRIGLQRNSDVGVAQALLHNPRMHTALQRDRGPGAAEAVEWDIWKFVAPERALERLVHALGMQRSPIGLAEGQAVVEEPSPTSSRRSIISLRCSRTIVTAIGSRAVGRRTTAVLG